MSSDSSLSADSLDSEEATLSELDQACNEMIQSIADSINYKSQRAIEMYRHYGDWPEWQAFCDEGPLECCDNEGWNESGPA